MGDELVLGVDYPCVLHVSRLDVSSSILALLWVMLVLGVDYPCVLHVSRLDVSSSILALLWVMLVLGVDYPCVLHVSTSTMGNSDMGRSEFTGWGMCIEQISC